MNFCNLKLVLKIEAKKLSKHNIVFLGKIEEMSLRLSGETAPKYFARSSLFCADNAFLYGNSFSREREIIIAIVSAGG